MVPEGPKILPFKADKVFASGNSDELPPNGFYAKIEKRLIEQAGAKEAAKIPFKEQLGKYIREMSGIINDL